MYDLAVVGAGIYGIQAARTYLEIHPDDKVIVLEASQTLGGVWSAERIYDAFWTQTPLRLLEFSDLPLTTVPKSETFHGFFPAKYVTEYLTSYAESRTYAGQSLLSRIRFNSKVETLIKNGEGWNLHVCAAEDDSLAESRYTACKVIDATGLTSNPNVPNIPGRDSYKGRIVHLKDFGRQQDSVFQSHKPQKIIVIGGAKSAADVAYACAKARNEVHWIIRRSGAGPAAFVSAKASWPYQNSNESFYNRIISFFLASWFFDESSTWLGRLLCRTSFGLGIVRAFWLGINRKARELGNYDRADGHENGFYNLRPDTDIFWQNDSTGVCQRDDFFDIIATKVKVYREDVGAMTVTGLELANGNSLAADIIIFATGWTTSHPKIQLEDQDEDVRASLGLSVPYLPGVWREKEYWSEKIGNAEDEVLIRFPILRDHPSYHQDATADTKAPLRLYRGLLPINDRSIAFLGQLLSGNNFRISEVQALYAVAALDGTLTLPAPEQMETTVAHTIAWNRLRYLTKGTHGSWIYWDMVPYTDDLLRELGLKSHLHNKWWKHLFTPCFASDLTGLIDEYRAKISLNRSVSTL